MTNGVVFDQQYTTALLRAARANGKSGHAMNAWRPIRTTVDNARALTALLLHGRAYLSQPSWLRNQSFPHLAHLESEGLVRWIPDSCYWDAWKAMSRLRTAINRSRPSGDALPSYWFGLVRMWEYSGFISRDDPHAPRVIAEAEMTDFILRQLTYAAPLLSANLELHRIKSKDLYGLVGHAVDTANAVVWDEEGESQAEAFGMPPWVPWPWLDLLFDDDEPHRRSTVRAAAATLDAAIAAYAALRHCETTALPLQSAGDRNLPSETTLSPKSHGDEAYQLMRIQFTELRYPVVDSLEDVLRLRDDPRLDTYRSVIEGYSARLRTELESERARTLHDFRRDMRLALKSLRSIKKWEQAAEVVFYLSLPLAIVGFVTNLPLSDILTIPVSGATIAVTKSRRRKYDWLLFGRPEPW